MEQPASEDGIGRSSGWCPPGCHYGISRVESLRLFLGVLRVNWADTGYIVGITGWITFLCLCQLRPTLNIAVYWRILLGKLNGLGSTRTAIQLPQRVSPMGVTDPPVTLARKVGPELQDLQTRARRILAERNAEKAEENTWIGWMIAAENINDMKALIKSHDSV